MNSKNRFILVNLMVVEFLLLNAVLILFLYFRIPEFSLTEPEFLIKIVKLTLVYNISWLFIILYIRDNYFYFNPNYHHLKSILTSLFFFVGFVASLVILFKIRYFNRSTFILPIFIFSYLNLISHKYLMRVFKKKAAHLFSNALLLGSTKEFSSSDNFINVMTQFGYNIIGSLDYKSDTKKNEEELSVLGSVEDLPKVLTTHPIDEIFISMSTLDNGNIVKAIDIADSFGVRVKLIPEKPMFLANRYQTMTMGGLAFFKLRQSSLDNFKFMIVKRLFDISFALLVLVLFSPIYLLVSILIRLDSKGPIFYTPSREGESGKTFKCFKFRTMKVSKDPLAGTKSTIKNDPRITRVGRILRKTDLDELPQFFNVLIGEMSVIGPRPHRVNLQRDLRESINEYMVRSYVRPGITGWAQVNGWRGPTITEEQKNERITHDLWYIENWSFWLDLKIIFLTVFGSHHKKAF